MRALITGIEGLCGRYLASWLRAQGDQIFGVDREHKAGQLPRLEGVDEIQRGDIRDEAFVFDCIRRFRPDCLYHLAGITTEPAHWETTRALYATNVNGTLNLLEAAAMEGRGDMIVLISSSSAVYAPPAPDVLPLQETAPAQPQGHYGMTKLAQEAMGQVYWHKRGLPVIIIRSFNIIGPGQSDAFVSSSLARQIAEAELGLGPPRIAVGNLDPQRDYVDVRDAVHAFWLAIEKGQPGEIYNVCSGRGYTVHQILEILLKCSALDPDRVHIEAQPQRIRATGEILFHYGDYSKLKQATGWHPEISLERSLIDLLDYWRRWLPNDRQDALTKIRVNGT